MLRQYYDGSFYQSYGRQYERTGYDRSSNTPASYQYEHKNRGIVHIGSKKLASRPVKQTELNIQMEITSQYVPSDRRLLGSTHNRQVRVNDDNTDTELQQLILGPTHKRGRCIRSDGLVIIKQLRKCSVRPSAENIRHSDKTTSNGYFNSSYVVSSNMVSKINNTSYRQSNCTTGVTKDSNLRRSTCRTSEKQGLASVPLENLWKTRLRCLGWSKRASTQSMFSLAQATLKTYNSYVNRYVEFCRAKDLDFSDEHNTNVIADFLCHISDKSDRPESVIKMCSAALTCMFEALGKYLRAHNSDIKRLITGIIKSGAVAPMKRSQPMPINSFVDLFHSGGNNEELTIKQLRMKTVTLLALVCMTRPSDLAPKGVNLDTRDLSVHNIVLTVDNIHFMASNSLTIFFFGIKNDTSRSGFEVNIPPNLDDIIMDPVSCLREYIDRTAAVRPTDTKPLLLTLNPPYKAISSSTISNILDEVISLAGLADKGFKAKSFRPMGATLAVSKGVVPKTVMQIGRWKTKEVFMNHYVYPRVPQSFTPDMFT